MSTHSKLAPSGASRWTECSASVPFIDHLKETGQIKENDSEWSIEGTIAHDWGAKILTGKATIADIQAGSHEAEGQTMDLTEEQAAEMRDAVGSYVELGQRLKTDEVFFHKVEFKTPLFYLPEDNGTLDHVLVSEKVVRIRDLKYGKGVIVEAKQNKQTAIYARSLIDQLRHWGIHDFPEDMLVVLEINQPRIADRGEQTVKLWSLSVGELYEFTAPIWNMANHLQGHFEEPDNFPVVFAPGEDACKFCDAKRLCQKRAEFNAEPIPFDVLGTFTNEDIEDNVFECLEPEQLVQLIQRKKEIVSWLNSLEKDALESIETGVEIPGLKVVEGKPGNRAWVNEDDAAKLVAKYVPAKDRYTKKLLSVAQMEKVLKPHKGEFSTRFKNRFDELITRPTGEHVLTLESDERPSITVKATETFDDETGGGTSDPLA